MVQVRPLDAQLLPEVVGRRVVWCGVLTWWECNAHHQLIFVCMAVVVGVWVDEHMLSGGSFNTGAAKCHA